MNKKPFALLVFLAILITLASCKPKTTESSPLSASLSELSGFVELKHAEENTFEQATSNSVLTVDGQVKTGDDGRVRLDLSSGTIIRVAPSSLFTLTSNDEVEGGLFTKIKLDIGKIFVILNGGQADVETPSGVASVRGSYMKVEVDPVTLDIYITCLEGNCSVTNPNGEVVNFSDGQSAILFHQDPTTGEWSSPQLGQMTPDEFQDWLDSNPEAKQFFDQGIATITALAENTEEPSNTEPAPTEAATEPATEAAPAGNSCSQLQEPVDNSVFGKIGQVTFAWSEQTDADYYILTFVNEDGSTARIQTTTNNASFYIEVLPKGGNYEWNVTAYKADGNEICTSDSANFSKPQADPTEKPTPADKPARPEPTEDLSQCDSDPCFSQQCPDYDPYYCSEFNY